MLIPGGGEGRVLRTVRAVSFTNYIEVARFVGLDPYAMLRRFKIAPESLVDPETRLPAQTAVDLFTASAAESGYPSFGLLLSECRTFASLGPISLLMEHQPTIRGMVEAMVRFVRHFSDITFMALEDDGETAIIHSSIVEDIRQPPSVEYTLANALRSLSEVSGRRWRPDRVHFRHSAPADLADYRRVLQCPVLFDADFDGIVCRSAMLDIVNPRADPTLVRYAEQLLGLVSLESEQSSVTESTRRSIQLLMPHGQADIDHVAANLGLHPRRLQRLLRKEGQSFTPLVDAVRRDLVVRHLASRRQTVAAVSSLAGYSTQSAFTRWFAHEFGESPATWRAGAHDIGGMDRGVA